MIVWCALVKGTIHFGATFSMARRVPLNDPATIIRYIEEDGGVILTGFSSIDDVQKVNADAAPYINAILEDVCSQRL